MDNLIEVIRNPATQAGNWLLSFSFISAWAAIYYVSRKRWGKFSYFTRTTVRAWCWMSIALTVYFAWFALSRNTAPTGELWNPTMVEYRWIAVTATALICAYGVSKFACLMVDAKPYTHWIMWAGLVILSIIVGIG